MLKKHWLSLALVGTISSITLTGCNNSSNDNNFELSIIHMNDIHSHVVSEDMGLEFNGMEVDVQIGGYPRAVTKIKALQDANENTLTLNAGDTFQGTLYYSFFNGDADSDMMNMINWDAMSLGNHEFDDGDEHLSNYLSNLTTLSHETILAANVEAPAGSPLENMWSPYTIKEFANGEKVGIIGIDIVGKTKYSSNPSDAIVFNDEMETAQTYIDELTAQGVNKIVLLSHVGLDNDKSYATQLSGVDIIIGGDSHSLMGDFSNVGLTSHDSSYPFQTTDKDGNKVCIGHAWEYAHAIGNMNVSFSGDGIVKSCTGNTVALIGDTFTIDDAEVNTTTKTAIETVINASANIETVAEDTTTLATLQTYVDQVDAKKAEVIGEVTERLGHNRIPGDNKDGVAALPLGSDIAPVVSKAFYSLSNRADACIQNAGGVRIAIEEGDVTYGDAYTLLPFANTLYELDMYGNEIKAVLEDAVDEALFGGDDGEISTGAFPYAYGLRYDVVGTEVKGNRIQNLEIKNRTTGEWSTISDNTMYVIVTNNYIAGGKDGYTTFKTIQDERGEGVDTYLDYAMSFINYTKSLTQNSETLTKLPTTDHPIKSYIAPVE
jgi:NAD pyrophosphatase/5'-nucleotidase NadN